MNLRSSNLFVNFIPRTGLEFVHKPSALNRVHEVYVSDQLEFELHELRSSYVQGWFGFRFLNVSCSSWAYARSSAESTGLHSLEILLTWPKSCLLRHSHNPGQVKKVLLQSMDVGNLGLNSPEILLTWAKWAQKNFATPQSQPQPITI